MSVSKSFVLAAVCLAYTTVFFAQNLAPSPALPLDPQRLKSIESFITTQMAHQKIPGLAVGIYSRGQILLAKGYGQANVELAVPVKAGTIFQSGSVGKQFVSAAIMMLVEEGKLSLDDSIAKYFPDAPATWKPILIKNLLSHTSGLAEYESEERTGPKGPFYMRLDFTEDELVTKIQALPIEAAPGEKWDYRNTNYVLLGILIHKVTGKPYYEFLSERIFKPLGMTSTRLISDRDIIPNRAAGYEIEDGQLKNQEWVSPTFNSTADGTLYFNVIDLAKWDDALYGTQLLKQSSLDRMWTVYSLNDGKPNRAGYGFGWSIGKQNDRKRIEHGGAWQGFTCDISRYPDDNLTVVVLTNLAGANPGLIAQITAGLTDSLLLPPKLLPIPDTQLAIATSLAKLLDQLMAGGDTPPQTTGGTTARIMPDGKWVRHRLANLWPGGTLTLVKRMPAQSPTDESTSVFRLSKKDDAVLIFIGSPSNGRIPTLRTAPDREYDW
ncbi:MAG TPA: serine hydrolase domain-containing protein [Candidatus Sulfotelmatobacter sp.]|nr:serine hydrolase domain-containing protein [Candidatus Sulfotelmatobacter sp.]